MCRNLPNQKSKGSLIRTSLAVQWLGLHASTAGGTGSFPGQGAKIPTCCAAKEMFFESYIPVLLNLVV